MLDIPIVLNNRNRLTTTRMLAEDLSKKGYTQVIILDNGSDYVPLLKWYESCPYRVVLLEKNLGQLALYNSELINEFLSGSWIAYSDSDIELNPATTSNFIQVMVEKAEKYHFSKIGLSLQINDLPDTPYANWVKDWESKFWVSKLEEDLYIADVDTTFCLVKVGLPFTYTALRLGGIYTCRHIPWYQEYDNLSEEEKYIIEHSDATYSTTRRFVASLLKP